MKVFRPTAQIEQQVQEVERLMDKYNLKIVWLGELCIQQGKDVYPL